MRAVRETAELLKNDGHDVVEVRFAFAGIFQTQFLNSFTHLFQFHPPPMDDLQRLYLGFTMADWGYELKKACGRDLYDSSTLLLRTICLILSLPRAVQFAIKWIASLISKISFPGISYAPAKLNSLDLLPSRISFTVPTVTGYGNMAAYKETMELIQKYHGDMDNLGLDAILTFASYHPAPVKVTSRFLVRSRAVGRQSVLLSHLPGNPGRNVSHSGVRGVELV